MKEQKPRRPAIDEVVDQAVSEWERSGELKELRGKPLDLSDRSPEWFGNKLLKEQGYSHPIIESARELDRLLVEAEAVGDRAKTASRRALRVPVDADSLVALNRSRERLLDEYREALIRFNKAVLTYNLTAPSPMHKRQVDVDERVECLARDLPRIPPVTGGAGNDDQAPGRSVGKRHWFPFRRG